MLEKFTSRLRSDGSECFMPTLTVVCMGVWVAIRCIFDALDEDDDSLAVGLLFLTILFCKVWASVRSEQARGYEVILLPSALLWAAWMAHRGVHFFIWWLPAILIVTVLAAPQLLLSLLSISIMLISVVLVLQYPITETWGVIAATIIVILIVSFYRLENQKFNQALRLKIKNMRIVDDAARVLYAEINPHGEVTTGSELLFSETGLSDRSDTLHLRDLIHSSDHALVMRTSHNAMQLAAGVISTSAACDCRLLDQDGGTSWMHAQFVRKQGGDLGLIVAFISIDERLRAEEALRESQRKLASQALELSAQFDAAKVTLHARQEVERLAQYDLRSPLKSIEATASLLRKGRVMSSKEDHLLTSIEHTAARALSMVTMSLDLYRMEEGTFQFVPETIDLVAIGRSVIAEFVHHARSKSVRLEFNSAASGLKATGSPVLTASIIENLVRNAIEAAPEHSVVTLAPYQGERVGMLIHNEGEVNESIRDEFFEKYATHGKRGGLGLGTYSARLIARAQGGDLTMTSSAQNGTLLLLKLKRAFVESDADAGVRPVPDSFGPSLPGNLIELPVTMESETPQSSLDMLVVEDDDQNWMLLLSWLPKHVGARRAINGREAVDALTMRRPDLVIMDLEMPVMGGFEALHRIREMQYAAGEEPSIIYAFTGYDDQDTVKKFEVQASTEF